MKDKESPESKTDFLDKNKKPPMEELPDKAVDWIWSAKLKKWIAVLPKSGESKNDAIQRVTDDHTPGRGFEDL